MTLNEFVESLNLPIEGSFSNDQYIITPSNSDEFSEVFNAISLNTDLASDNYSLATEDETRFIYTDGEFEINIEANFKDNLYNIIIGER